MNTQLHINSSSSECITGLREGGAFSNTVILEGEVDLGVITNFFDSVKENGDVSLQILRVFLESYCKQFDVITNSKGD